MFKSFKGRTIEQGQKIEVYRNLHNGLWSIRDAKTKLVLGHAASVTVKTPDFIVNEAGRQRVLREQKKNVHAFIKGTYVTDMPARTNMLSYEVTYNPYRFNSFVGKVSQLPVTENSIEYVSLTNKVEAFI